MARPTDYLVLTIPTPAGDVHRPWGIEQPRASVALTLRAQIVAALGVNTNAFAAAILAMDPDMSSRRGAVDVNGRSAAWSWEEQGTALFRNARAGRAIRGIVGGALAPVTKIRQGADDLVAEEYVCTPTVGMVEAVTALRVVASAAGLLGEGSLSTAAMQALVGRVERDELVEAGLLWQLAYASSLTLRRDSPDAQALIIAHDRGVLEWVAAMDEFLHVDEAELLWAWCLVHCFRPF
jgi:hypothetical protein